MSQKPKDMRRSAIAVWNRCAAEIAVRYFEAARDDEGERFVNDISIVGSMVFRDQVRQAIQILGYLYPYGQSLVSRHLVAIVAFAKAVDFGIVGGFCFEIPRHDGSLAWTADRFAAILVRKAILARLAKRQFCVFRNARVQAIGWRAELHCMRILKCHKAYVEQQEHFMKRMGVPPLRRVR